MGWLRRFGRAGALRGGSEPRRSPAPGEGARKSRERAFHDTAWADAPRARLAGAYDAARSIRDHFFRLALDRAGEHHVLELGCGTGIVACRLARHGKVVTAVDLSPVAIAAARRRAAAAGVSVDFRVMDGESLAFPDGAFDLVCGMGTLHHLDLRRALPGIRRVLRPGGRAIFVEALGRHPILRLYRRLTPALRTPDEHPLTRTDLQICRAVFPHLRFIPFYLTAALPAGLHFLPGALPCTRLLEWVDRGLFALCPRLGIYAWQALLMFENVTVGPGADGVACNSPNDQMIN